MLSETRYFWLGVLLVGMAGGFFSSAYRLFRDYKSAPKPEDAIFMIGLWVLFGTSLAMVAAWAWGQTAVAVYLNWWQ